tara:strand:- start:26 stop:529 length:504 start_codon:yes stop_codon:yes gene_type:complete
MADNIVIDLSKSNTLNSPSLKTKNDSEDEIEKQFNDVLDSMGSLKQYITQVQNKIRILEKNVKKEQKTYAKFMEKKQRTNRKPSGFAKPTPVSDELCDFMKREKGTHLARTEVTKYIISYIENQKLQDESNKKKIVPNQSLKKLLGVSENDEVTYFNLQKLMNRHFI